jgi:hypothetical protein
VLQALSSNSSISFSYAIVVGRVSERRELALYPLELAARLDEPQDRRAAEVRQHRHVTVAGRFD